MHNPIALAIALGVAIVPCLYAWLNIAANEVRGLSQNMDAKVQGATNALQAAQAEALGTDLNEVNMALDSFVAVGKQLETATQLVDLVISQTVDVAGKLADTLRQTNDALGLTRSSLGELTDTFCA